jgi:hypothetical protein
MKSIYLTKLNTATLIFNYINLIRDKCYYRELSIYLAFDILT